MSGKGGEKTVTDKSLDITVRSGYYTKRIVERRQLQAAERILRDRRLASRYLRAEKIHEGGACYVEFTWEIWCCPCCGRSFLNYKNKAACHNKGKWKAAVDGFLREAVTGEDHARLPRSLVINEEDDGVLNVARICKHCRKRSISDDTRRWKTVSFRKTDSSNDKKITVTLTGIKAVQLLMTQRNLDAETLIFSDTFTESIVFDLHHGITKRVITNERTGELMEDCNLDEKPSRWSGPIYELLSECHHVKRVFRKVFSELYGAVPFSSSEIAPKMYVEMCRFQGFPKEFYKAIPYDTDTMEIHSSFAETGESLRTVKTAIIYANSFLPNKKSIRRFVFQKRPGLLFYTKEIGALYELLREDHLMNTLQKDEVYTILSNLHNYPMLLDYFRELLNGVLTRKQLVSMLQNQFIDKLLICGLMYSAGSPYMREKLLCMDGILNQDGYISPAKYSIPLEERLDPMTICGYSFRNMGNQLDVTIAGRQLSNCLVDWFHYDQHRESSTVVIIQDRFFRAVAAVEVDFVLKEVIQAYSVHNEEISRHDELYHAFVKWCRKNGLSFDDYEIGA